MLLAISLSGVVAAAALVSAISAPPAVDPAVVADTTLTFEDTDGNGIDDDCQTGVVVVDPIAAAAAETAADLDGDGAISTSEAAQSNRVGGKNCNHGGYVSSVAHVTDQACEPTDATQTGTETGTGTETADETPDADETDNETDNETADAAETPEPPETEPADAACDQPAAAVVEPTPTPDAAQDAVVPAPCVPTTPAVAPADTLPADTAPNAHGKAVSEVAHSDAVGGKNCNHGGAVSEAAKKDQAAKDAKKAEQAKKHGSKVHGNKR